MARPGSGTLAVWPPLPPMAAKTGTLKHTLALAGMLAADDVAGALWLAAPAAAAGALTPAEPSEPIFFAIFLNHDLRARDVQRREIGALLRAWRQLAAGTS
jgi:hypothetical protein